MTRIRRFFPAFLAIPLAFLLTACNMDYTLRVIDENKIQDVITVNMTAEEKDQLAMMSMGKELTCETLFSEMDSAASDAQYNTLSPSDGGMGCEVVQSHDSRDLNLTKSGDKWTLVLDGSNDLNDLDKAKAQLGSLGSTLFTVGIEMPANITSVEPEIGKVDGTKVTFDIFKDNLSQQITITAESGAGGGMSSGLIIALVVALVLVIGAVLLLVLLRKKKSQPNLQTSYQQQGYPPVNPTGLQPDAQGQPQAWQPQASSPQQPWPPQQPAEGQQGPVGQTWPPQQQTWTESQPVPPAPQPQSTPPAPPAPGQPYSASPEIGDQNNQPAEGVSDDSQNRPPQY